MKFSRILLLLFVSAFFSCQEEVRNTYTINGEAKDLYNGLRVYLNEISEKGSMVAIDTAVVVNETFFFNGRVSEPKLLFLTVQSVPGRLPFMIENSEIAIKVDKKILVNSAVSGSKNNTDLKEYIDRMKTMNDELKQQNLRYSDAKFYNNEEEMAQAQKDIEQLLSDFKSYPYEFIASHKSSYASFQALEGLIRNKEVDYDALEASYNSLDDALKQSGQGVSFGIKLKDFKMRLEKARATEIGKIAPEFSAPTPAGDLLAVSDVYSKGKITIVDFWAAWCGPCRRENPNIVKIYREFHDKGLEILGVSLDGRRGQQDPKGAWIQAIEDDGLSWNHVSNLSYFGPIAQQYNINAIPAMFILDNQGKIIAKNLRGRALADKVAELLAP
jgi:thiol-disulfide isomerase/thioredoxin